MTLRLPAKFSNRIEKSRERWIITWNLEKPDRVVWIPPQPPIPKEEQVPAEKYFNLDPEGMLQYHLNLVKNQLRCPYGDYVPYLDSWFGTSVLSSALGAEYRITPGDVLWGDWNGGTWTVPMINDPADIEKLEQPDPYRDGLMPRVLKTLDHWRQRVGNNMPISVTNTQGPLGDASQIMEPTKMLKAMYTHPDLIKKLFELITDTFIEWNLVQKEHIGQDIDESFCSGYGSWLPKGVGGIMISDDAAAYISPNLYEKFVVPCNSQILEKFRGGIVHWCGNAMHNYANVLKISHIRGIHNGTMDHLGVKGAKHPGRESVFELRKLTRRHVIQCKFEHNPKIETMEEFWKETFSMFLPDGGILIVAGFGPIDPATGASLTMDNLRPLANLPYDKQFEIYLERVSMLSQVIEKYGRYKN